MTENKIIEQIRQLLRIASDRGASVNERRARRLRVRHWLDGWAPGRPSRGYRLVLTTAPRRLSALCCEGRRGALY